MFLHICRINIFIKLLRKLFLTTVNFSCGFYFRQESTSYFEILDDIHGNELNLTGMNYCQYPKDARNFSDVFKNFFGMNNYFYTHFWDCCGFGELGHAGVPDLGLVCSFEVCLQAPRVSSPTSRHMKCQIAYLNIL